MSSLMTRSLPDDPILIHAYLDGELDSVDALEMEKRIASDPALAAAFERIKALRQLMQELVPREAPSAELRTRIESAVAIQAAAHQPSWRALAASIAVTAVIASGSTWMVLERHQTDATASAITAAHVRGLMAPQATDVTSSETHTVKPWFSGRIPQAPRVVDLVKADFPLVGGRIDVIDRSPSPTLVYSRRKHLISVTAVPTSNRGDAAPARANVDGYNVVLWVDAGVTYWAVSDLNAQELEEFVKLFRAV